MAYIMIFLIAVGLAMDAFAVAVVSGSTYEKLHIKHAFRIATFFGVFQALMPITGYFCGLGIKNFVEGYAHWVAFILLCAIGGKMLYEARKINPQRQRYDISSMIVLLSLSIATSIDALVVGVTISILSISIFLAAVIIGIVTFLFSYAGVYIGERFGHFFENRIEAAGGLILIGLGLKVLIQHFF